MKLLHFTHSTTCLFLQSKQERHPTCLPKNHCILRFHHRFQYRIVLRSWASQVSKTEVIQPQLGITAMPWWRQLESNQSWAALAFRLAPRDLSPYNGSTTEIRTPITDLRGRPPSLLEDDAIKEDAASLPQLPGLPGRNRTYKLPQIKEPVSQSRRVVPLAPRFLTSGTPDTLSRYGQTVPQSFTFSLFNDGILPTRASVCKLGGYISYYY